MSECKCTLNTHDETCKDGPWLFDKMLPVVSLAKHREFFDLSASQRETMWSWFNEAANKYLGHINFRLPPTDYSKILKNDRVQKYCQFCQKETTWVLWLYPKTGGTILICGSCKEKRILQVAVLKWKLEMVKDCTLKFQFNQVMEWVEAHYTFTELDNNIEEWAMGMPDFSEQWRSYSRLYGIILANHKAPYKPE